MLLRKPLEKVIRRGKLTVVDATGAAHAFGDGTGPEVTVRLADKRLEWELLFDAELRVGEAYMDERLLLEQGDLHDFLDICMSNGTELPIGGMAGLVKRSIALARRVGGTNPIGVAQRNVAHHYDLSGELYRLFLDDEREYTCAYFPTGSETIEQAQRAKEDLVARKLLLEPGMKVADLGCGWGALGLALAREWEVDVTGVTLSKEQSSFAQNRAVATRSAQRARFRLEDYRLLEGQFDRVVSIGMLEHVGRRHYDEMFGKIRALLKEDGVALVHAMGHMSGPPAVANAWIRKYIFPGGYIPALSEVIPAIERAGLWITDVEILRLHYAETLARWRERFEANRERVRELYDERFCRMWEFYLVCSELMFRRQDAMVFHIQLARSRDAVPLTRDYLFTAETHGSAPHLQAAE